MMYVDRLLLLAGTWKVTLGKVELLLWLGFNKQLVHVELVVNSVEMRNILGAFAVLQKFNIGFRFV
jgi:hypothetical protein